MLGAKAGSVLARNRIEVRSADGLWCLAERRGTRAADGSSRICVHSFTTTLVVLAVRQVRPVPGRSGVALLLRGILPDGPGLLGQEGTSTSPSQQVPATGYYCGSPSRRID